MAKHLIYLVYVARPESSPGRHIRKGSAIVGEPVSPLHVNVHFEGNIYNSQNLRKFSERLACAAGRRMKEYPTIACGTYNRNDLVEVGSYEVTTKNLMLDQPELLVQWLDKEELQ